MPPKKASKHKKEAAARARTGRAKVRKADKSGTVSTALNPEFSREANPSPEPRAASPVFVDSDLEWESGYQGGVNHCVGSEGETDMDDDGEVGCESVDEDEEVTVAALKEKAYLYTRIQQTKPAREWKIRRVPET
ncbi:hypothetical protein H0H81_009853, partial [Sphagnurus paluster]